MLPALTVVRSASHDPAANLALEEYFLRHLPTDHTTLFVCRNASCFIIGRNQNPWQEAHISAITRANARILRRISGGGAVYHDLGNVNFSLITSRKNYEPGHHAELAVQALNTLGVSCHRAQRNDILCDDRKISGTAYMLTGKRTLQHATMLVSANLNQLRSFIRTGDTPFDTHAVQSRPAKVANLAHLYPAVTVDTFISALIQAFQDRYEPDTPCLTIDPASLAHNPAFTEFQAKHKNPDWLWNRTPTFTHTLRCNTQPPVTLELTVEKGRITTVTPARDADGQNAAATPAIAQRLTQCPYTHDHLETALQPLLQDPHAPTQSLAHTTLNTLLRDAFW